MAYPFNNVLNYPDTNRICIPIPRCNNRGGGRMISIKQNVIIPNSTDAGGQRANMQMPMCFQTTRTLNGGVVINSGPGTMPISFETKPGGGVKISFLNPESLPSPVTTEINDKDKKLETSLHKSESTISKAQVTPKQDTSTTKSKDKVTSKPDTTKSKDKVMSKVDTIKSEDKVTSKVDTTKSKDKVTSKPDTTKSKDKVTSKLDTTKSKDKVTSKPDATKSKDKVTSKPDATKSKDKVTSKPDATKSKDKVTSKSDTTKPKASNSSLPEDKSKTIESKEKVYAKETVENETKETESKTDPKKEKQQNPPLNFPDLPFQKAYNKLKRCPPPNFGSPRISIPSISGINSPPKQCPCCCKQMQRILVPKCRYPSIPGSSLKRAQFNNTNFYYY